MLSKLALISEKSQQDKKRRFSAIVHHINAGNLLQCFTELKRNKASGIDNVKLDEYGANLKSNIEFLVARMKSKQYRPKPVKRVYIPKPGKGEMRPLGIPAVADKLVVVLP